MKLKLPTSRIILKCVPMKDFRLLLGLVLILQLYGQHTYSQNHGGQDALPEEILKKSILYPQLWKESNLNPNDVHTIYLLNHGIEALNDLPLNLKLNNKPVVLINKGTIDKLDDSPYFLLHTLNVEGTKALARIYMSYVLNGERNTSDLIEIAFTKSNDHWEITTDEL